MSRVSSQDNRRTVSQPRYLLRPKILTQQQSIRGHQQNQRIIVRNEQVMRPYIIDGGASPMLHPPGGMHQTLSPFVDRELDRISRNALPVRSSVGAVERDQRVALDLVDNRSRGSNPQQNNTDFLSINHDTFESRS